MPKPKVLIFDDKDGVAGVIWHEALTDAAYDSGWEPQLHTDPHAARYSLGKELGAVISVLGANSGNFLARLEGGFEGTRVLGRAQELDIPRALFSGHPKALDIVAPIEVNLVVSSAQDPGEVRLALGIWLTNLALH